MRTMIMVMALLMSANLMAHGKKPIKKELEDKVTIDLHDYDFKKDQEEFVLVSFVVKNQKIEILDIMGSNEFLIDKMKSELNNITMDNFYPSDDKYNFKFTFSKQ